MLELVVALSGNVFLFDLGMVGVKLIHGMAGALCSTAVVQGLPC